MLTSPRETFHYRGFVYRFLPLNAFVKTTFGITSMSFIFIWAFGQQDYTMTSIRNFFNEKLLKYIPIDAGGNIIFPFYMYSGAVFREYPRTQWSSFDQRSSFPHTDRFKMKIAICHEDFSMIKALLNRQFDINSIIDDKKQLTAINLAASLGKTEVIEYLYSRGADLEAKDSEGNTALMQSVIFDHPQACKRLILLGADLKSTDRYGFTAADKARNRGRLQIAEFLTEIPQQPTIKSVNPITYKLEELEYISHSQAKEITEKYDIMKYYKPSIYPYYKQTRGLLTYFFGSLDTEDLELQVQISSTFNQLDDVGGSDQELFTFGEALAMKNPKP